MKAVAIGAKVLLLASALLASNDGAGAATIEVAAVVVEVAQDDQCSLIEALENANGDANHTECTAGEEGLDTVVPAAGSVHTLTAVHNDFDGPTGLPIVTTPVVLRGNRATIERSSDSGTPPFRLLYVYHPSGELTVDTLTLRNGQDIATRHRHATAFSPTCPALPGSPTWWRICTHAVSLSAAAPIP